jgi:two-component system sensor histidine kinase KdpD
MKAESRAQALAEADQMKTALLSMVSHDFRSPLTSIKASISTLLGEGNPVDAETQRSLLQGVDHETDRLNRMVGNILDLSRLEAGAWRPRKESTELSELIGAALDCFDASANARIQVEIDSRIHEIVADAVQMVQVVKNLVENALKYSPEASPIEIEVALGKDSLIIEVLDRGAGLPKGDEHQIFEPFYRAPGLKESSVPGLGIGLALCRGLVEANGGSLTARNREGGGAVFRVTLPSSPCPDLYPKQ